MNTRTSEKKTLNSIGGDGLSLVSIIIPSFNRAVDLERALRSVLCQTYKDWEVVVIDNHSTDRTLEVISRIADPRISIYQIHNQGLIAASRNLGVAKSRGEFIAFLDSDDWWVPKKLEVSLNALKAGADVVYHDLILAEGKKKKIISRRTVRSRQVGSPVYYDLLKNGNALLNSGVVVRRSVLGRVGPFPVSVEMNQCCDYEAWLAISKHTERFKRIGGAWGYYWFGGGNTTSDERLVRTLLNIERKYESDLRSISAKNPYWIRYLLGRAYYRLGLFKEARDQFTKIPLLRTPVVIILKVIVTLLLTLRGDFSRSARTK
jgi:glycosyltransferase involved in cell wall biosynthesis